MRGIDIVRDIYAAYAARDIEKALSWCSDDICFRWKADPGHAPHAGVCTGKGAFLERLLGLDADYEYRAFVPTRFVDGGDDVAVEIEISMARRSDGKPFTMHTANFWRVSGGKAVEMVEYYDSALAGAMR